MFEFLKSLYRKVRGRPTLAEILTKVTEAENSLVAYEARCIAEAAETEKQIEALRKKRESLVFEAEFASSVSEGIRKTYI